MMEEGKKCGDLCMWVCAMKQKSQKKKSNGSKQEKEKLVCVYG